VRLLDYLTGLVSLLALPFIAWWSVNQSPQSAARLEARLETKAHQALQLAGIDWASVDMDGQTAILTGGAPSGDAAEEAARVVLRSSGQGGGQDGTAGTRRGSHRRPLAGRKRRL
jgi:OOP family OmpA-OmpF porin